MRFGGWLERVSVCSWWPVKVCLMTGHCSESPGTQGTKQAHSQEGRSRRRPGVQRPCGEPCGRGRGREGGWGRASPPQDLAGCGEDFGFYSERDAF